jgi:hypothetical protein
MLLRTLAAPRSAGTAPHRPTSAHVRGLSRTFATLATRRVCLQVQYDGAGFNGWEKKPGTDTRTVQGCLEHAACSAFGKAAADFAFPVQVRRWRMRASFHPPVRCGAASRRSKRP